MEIDYVTDVRKYMHRELEAVEKIEKNLDVAVNQVIASILNAKGKVVFTGVGKSGHIAEKLAATFASTGTPAFFVHSTEGLHGDLGMLESNDIVIAISNSGETSEVLRLISTIRRIGCLLISFSKNPESSLAKESDISLILPIDNEADDLNLAPSNSSTSTLVVGDAIAFTISKYKNFRKEDFALFHPGGALGKQLLHS